MLNSTRPRYGASMAASVVDVREGDVPRVRPRVHGDAVGAGVARTLGGFDDRRH